MHYASLSSGSEQNCSYVEGAHEAFLIDAGVSVSRVRRFVSSIGGQINKLQGIVMTHEHTDHSRHLLSIAEEWKLPVYMHPSSMRRLQEMPRQCVPIEEKQMFAIGDLQILPFPVKHDAAHTFAFRVFRGEKSLVHLSDAGSFHRHTLCFAKGAELVAIESNYDAQMLQHSHYPARLKRRIASQEGHLSNKAANFFVKHTATDQTHTVVLLHISKQNNSKECVMHGFQDAMHAFPQIQFHIADRTCASPLFPV